MTTSQVTQVCREMLIMSTYLAGPVIVAGMVVGLLISIVQTITQIQEQSISFVVKIVASALALLFFAPWMLAKIIDFSARHLGQLDQFLR
jgi:flagellar biosynthesis protein FliQ